MKVLAIAATNSRKSINKALLGYAAKLLEETAEVEVLDINDFPLPIYSADLEEEEGIPEPAQRFLARIARANALLISYAEHNGGHAVAYKNLFDWASRHNRNVYQGRPIVMLATSPGPGGASSVLSASVNSAHFFDGDVVASLSVPSFYDNFDMDRAEISNASIRRQLIETLEPLAKTGRVLATAV
ncbi:NADPH-dependent FMN reductase [Microbulbifer taiwanensis]|uniref:NADPH-dependent FMN reductase n=1 Tax=Microbulbifer taiwanensis TaxID=986746 RepID=A0ABW1YM11_9GAMM|nr:NAD(P)H-dependent oxidoreductase [Microbulbifer taiwanensis]